MRKFILLAIFSFIGTFYADAQIVKTLHKTYDIGAVANLTFEVVGEYEVIPWAGSSVLIETTIELYDANINIYKHFLKAGRYNIDLALSDHSAAFVSHDKVRNEIKLSGHQCWEIVKYIIRIPEEFDIIDKTRSTRPTNSEVTSDDAN